MKCCPTILAAACLTLSGCTTAMRMASARIVQPPAPVSEILAVWQPGEGRDADGLPTRGFAGRIFFFSATSPAPVAVDGAVTVYLFDDRGDTTEQSKPLHQFHFEPAAWETHRTESDVGTAYQIFLPYVRGGDFQAVCSLRVRYEPADGPQTLSESADVTLVGRDAPVEEPAPDAVRPISHTSAAPERSLRVHTIPLGKQSQGAGR